MKPQIEPLDDLPVIFSIIKEMRVIESINSVFIPHKNWTGITVGELTAIWLCYLISQHDHRLSYLEEWASNKLNIISILLDREVTIYDFKDDKLELLLGYFSEQTQWNEFETSIDKEAIKIFDLKTDLIEVDATIGKSFKKAVEGGLFQYGNSKQFRSDLTQFKTMLCTLDPLGYPMGSLTVSGNTADDTLYVPVIEQAMRKLPHTGSLFMGDCKLASMSSRAFIHKNNHHYLCPLSGVQIKQDELNAYINDIETKQIELQQIYKDKQVIAKGYSTTKQLWKIDEQGELVIWTEKRQIVRSYVYAKTQIEALVKRLNNCETELLSLNIHKQGKKTYEDKTDLEIECKRIIKKHKVETLIVVEITEKETLKQIRQWKDRQAREEKQTDYTVKVIRNKDKIRQKKKLLGWRVYATNCTNKNFTLEKIVLLYRKEYIIERRFDYLKNKTLNLIPIYLRTDKYIIGLINVLLLALRVISLIEFKVARNLEKSGKELAGLYPANPKQKTKSPSVTLILRAFFNIYCFTNTDFKNMKMEFDVTELKPLQKKLLRLLNMTEEIYTKFSRIVTYEQNNLILKTD
jgi:transposase